MWYQDLTGIGLAYSDDGINWTDIDLQALPVDAAHPDVLYDANGFGGGGYKYKMWYWDSNEPLTSITTIAFTQSNDGMNWTTPVACSQDPIQYLVSGASADYFYNLYGPGTVQYNPNATSTPGDPYSYPYVMLFDSVSTGGVGGSEQTGLAYSSDGLFWTRYGSVPVMIPTQNPSDWDSEYMYQAHYIKVAGVYHAFYSGSNGNPLGSLGNTTAHGIGHASSVDGITWVRDPDNPIFIVTDGIAWRNGRTYSCSPLLQNSGGTDSCGSESCELKMWFAGFNASDIASIGYATAACPLPSCSPLPPTSFQGKIRSNQFLNRTESVLQTSWVASLSSNISYYQIYKNGKPIAQVSSTAPLYWTTCGSHASSDIYEISAVNNNGFESSRTRMTL